MSESKKPEAIAAKHGEKMIEVKVRFWTNHIAAEPGKLLPRHAQTKGIVRIESNEAHGIKAVKEVPFNSLMEIPLAIEEVLLASKVVLHTRGRMKKYVTHD